MRKEVLSVSVGLRINITNNQRGVLADHVSSGSDITQKPQRHRLLM